MPTSLPKLSPGFLLALALLLAGNSAMAEWAPDIAVGDRIPPLSATDQEGNLRTLDTLMGQNGAVFFFNRSTSW